MNECIDTTVDDIVYKTIVYNTNTSNNNTNTSNKNNNNNNNNNNTNTNNTNNQGSVVESIDTVSYKSILKHLITTLINLKYRYIYLLSYFSTFHPSTPNKGHN